MGPLLPLAELLFQGRTLPDTTIMRMVPPDATGIQQVMAWIGGGAVLLPYLLFGAAIWAALRMRKSFEAAQASFDEVGQDLKALADHANRIAGDVAAVSESVRSSVGSVQETVEYANRRAHHAVTALADRVDEFNHALGVAQRDTQSVIVTAIAAMKGVRAGVSALRKPRRERPAESDDLTEEPDDDETPPDLPARPRLRRRARGDR